MNEHKNRRGKQNRQGSGNPKRYKAYDELREKDSSESYDDEYESEEEREFTQQKKLYQPSKNMSNVLITTNGFRTKLASTNYFKGKEKHFEV